MDAQPLPQPADNIITQCMSAHRRQFLKFAVTAGAMTQIVRSGFGQWFPLTGDDGKQVDNLRLPVELRSEIETLAGVLWLGASSQPVTLVEFFDYNCPYCRQALNDLEKLFVERKGFRLGLVNNAILSAGSVEAAKVQLAMLRLKGVADAYRLHRRLFAERGSKDRQAALNAASGIDVDLSQLARTADSKQIGDALEAQMHLAAAFGFSSTPSFVIGTAGILGYPGPRTIEQVIGNAERCGEVVCG